jgi:hypothetical protein
MLASPMPKVDQSGQVLVAILLGCGILHSMMKKENANTTPLLVQDRKTGQWYNPMEAWIKVMETKEVRAIMERLKNR